MKCLFLIAICSLTFIQASVAQLSDSTLIAVTGRIIDKTNEEPVDGARIKYESLPYGSKIGVFSGSTFTFNMEDGNDYILVVEADGYAPYSQTLKSSDAVNQEIAVVIELQPNGINRLIRLDKLIFGLGKAKISEESYEELNALVKMLESSPTMQIQLEGHTDFRGNERANMKLSEDRVDAVKNYLVKQGIDRRRIRTKAFGGTQPLSRGSDDESRTQNRRVEVRILSN
ncbi:OmpA family protein [Fulvivirga aurantia]|uniref:OmpA family protein n=1 Tax=Fulvivirga aurantia TaxID=2529383 RepID=UPI00162AB307|nr:OmpA family protein [Fulvivirga aurantia]